MDSADFGRYLSQQRELRGLTLRAVAQATKIPESLLLALESGQLQRMPARVFVMNYVRAYAGVIGLEPEEAVLRFQEVEGGAPVEGQASRQDSSRRKSGPWLWVGVLLALALVAYLVASFSGDASGITLPH